MRFFGVYVLDYFHDIHDHGDLTVGEHADCYDG